MPERKKRAAAYVRVSTDGQAEGTSLDTQEERILERAKKEGRTVWKEDVYVDVDSATLHERAALQRLLGACRSGWYDTVYVLRADRMARSGLDQLNLLMEFKRAGVDVVFVEGVSGTDELSQLLHYVSGWAAERERLLIKKRTSDGRWGVAAKGRMPVGRAPYGYGYDKMTQTRYVIEEQANIVRRVFLMRASGMQFRTIAGTLNKEGIRTANGAVFRTNTIKRMLKRTSYIGVDYYGQTEVVPTAGEKMKTVPRAREDWVELVEYSPAILDSWVWDKVQATMDMPQASASKASGAGYLLTGLVRCADCGRAVVGCTRVWSKSKKEYKYYRCNCDFVRPGLGVACHAGRISAAVLEGVVWEYALGLVANPAGVVEQVLAQAEEGKEDLDAEIDRCKAEVRKCGAEELKLLEVYRKGVVSLEAFEAQNGPVRALREELEKQLRAAVEKKEAIAGARDAGRRVEEYCERFRDGIGEFDFQGKRELMYALGIRVLAKRGDVSISAVVDPGFVVS